MRLFLALALLLSIAACDRGDIPQGFICLNTPQGTRVEWRSPNGLLSSFDWPCLNCTCQSLPPLIPTSKN